MKDLPPEGQIVMIQVIDGSQFLARRENWVWLSVGSNIQINSEAIAHWWETVNPNTDYGQELHYNGGW